MNPNPLQGDTLALACDLCIVGLFTAIILFTAVAITAPLFIVMVVLVVISWLT